MPLKGSIAHLGKGVGSDLTIRASEEREALKKKPYR